MGSSRYIKIRPKKTGLRQKRSRIRPGAPPGTIVSDPHSATPVIRIMAHSETGIEELETSDMEHIRRIKEKWPVIWIHVDGLGDSDLLKRLAAVFSIHPLALEDVLNQNQRPKLEQYGDHYFLVLPAPREKDQAPAEQMNLFVGDDFVVTIDDKPGPWLEPVRERIRQGRVRIRKSGADYLSYAITDVIIDHYFPAIEAHAENLERLEDKLLVSPSREMVGQIHAIRNDLLDLRRVLFPLRDAINGFRKEEISFFTAETLIYFRDCHDHVQQLIDAVETHREATRGLFDLYLSSLSNRMSEVMKVLTIIATIFIPLSFIASLYGMNFDTRKSPWNMPELEWSWGYPFALSLMALTAVSLLLYLRRKGWLGYSMPKVKEKPGSRNPDGQGVV